MNIRQAKQILPACNVTDGAGVKIKRSLGSYPLPKLDPFLMLDEFGSNNPREYIEGFPPHPHRGFETVTYMLEGHMLHEDHMGNKGHLRSGDVQWMTAAHGIIHSEMPQQQEGRLHGFQLWINLPAKEKMKPASYRDIPAAKIPVVDLGNGGTVKVIAGEFAHDEQTYRGPVSGLTTEPVYLDVVLPAGQLFRTATKASHNACVYIYAGQIRLDPNGQMRQVAPQNAVLMSDGEAIEIRAERDSRFLVLTAQPLNEPVAQLGPFVMNTREELEQAISDFQTGKLVAAKATALNE